MRNLFPKLMKTLMSEFCKLFVLMFFEAKPDLFGLFYIFHVYLGKWHSDVSRHWPLNQAVASTACVSRKRFNGLPPSAGFTSQR
jgi:hypothetical protein